MKLKYIYHPEANLCCSYLFVQIILIKFRYYYATHIIAVAFFPVPKFKIKSWQFQFTP